MLERFRTSGGERSASPLPRRRWLIRAPRTLILGLIGAAIGGLLPFLGWWFRGYPLWVAVVPMVLGWFALMPRPLYLGLDERGMALIAASWTGESYLWIPQDRLIRLETRQGWLVATGTTVEQQGNFSWPDAARQAGAMLPAWANLHLQSGLATTQVAAPIHLLDKVARDEIELWMYRQGKG